MRGAKGDSKRTLTLHLSDAEQAMVSEYAQREGLSVDDAAQVLFKARLRAAVLRSTGETPIGDVVQFPGADEQ